MLRAGGRWFALIAAVLVTAVVIGGVAIYLKVSDRNERALCAQLSDSAGLYVGNAVNIRGVKVGRVTSVSPEPGHVTVRMSLEDRPLNADLSVVAVNNSVLADRRLELVNTEVRGGPQFSSSSCVPLKRTMTPISVSAAFQSFTTMFNKIGGAGSDSTAPVGNLIAAADSQFQGTGGDINKIVNNVAGFMSAPETFLSQMHATFNNLAVLTDLANENWGEITEIGENAATLTQFMGTLFLDFVDIFDGLGRAGPGLDDLISNVLPPVFDLADKAEPAIDVALSHVDDLNAIIENLPGITTGLTTSLNRKAQAVSISYRSPKVLTKTPNSGALCALLNKSEPGSCNTRSGVSATVDLTDVVAQAIQGGIR